METTTREPVAATGGELQASPGTAVADGIAPGGHPAPPAAHDDPAHDNPAHDDPAHDTPAHDGPALELATLFRPIMLRLDLLVRRQNTQYELSRAQTSILHTLANHGPLRMSYLARLENVRVPTTSNSVSVIESMGYVTRIPDEADRRGVSVALTDLGRDRIKQVLMDRDRDFAEQLSRLSPEHRALLADAVPALTSLLDAFDAD